jgi:toxin secretion/phage lysis holin
MREIATFMESHMFFVVLLYAVILDTVLGVLRAVKEHKFNSSAGIDGAIRKVAMMFSVVFLILVDSLVDMNFLFMIPEEYLKYLGITKLGICELFCLLFILYEAVSILKNMTLCGLPVPAKIKYFIQKFLDNMTEELPEEITKELHEKEVDAGTYNQIHGDSVEDE